MSKRSPKLLVQDILESGQKIIKYTDGISFEEFVNDSKTVDAVSRNFEIIGEAANRLPDEFKEAHPNINGHKIRGFRNRIIHDYFGIDFNIVWIIKETFLPDTIVKIKKIDL
ncbi:MAG: DUF86 domain-containing protein [Bacteroidetes bacterium]|nr:DUF86 domain-containing protein [Bacteroidota bacterium]MBK9321282.1 DUF86 domain-containing protein [Bacteroidota bacterium]